MSGVIGETGADGPAEAVYRQRRDAFAREEARLGRTSFRFSVVRAVLFFGFLAGLGGMLATAGSPRPGWLWMAAGFLAVFLAVLPFHSRVARRQARAAEMRRINEEALLRLARDWQALPLPEPPAPSETEPGAGSTLSRDLDLFGRASVFHWLGTAHTPDGKATFSRWLHHPAPPGEVARRQAAVAELAPELDLRQRLEERTRPFERVRPDVEPFLCWTEEPPWLLGRRGLLAAAYALPVLTVGAAAAAVHPAVPLAPFLLLVTVNVVLTWAFGERLNGTLDRVSAREREFLLYSGALEVVDEQVLGQREPAVDPTSEALQEIARELSPGDRPAHAWMARLQSRVDLADTRHSALLHFPLQLLFLWDFHTVRLLEAWRREAGRHARGWLAALGRFEVLAALAGAKHDHPDWAFPEVTPAADRLEARGLGHPLIPDGRRVTNDVTVGPPGSFLLVTGSNMSGKSTLLRSLGINAALAQAGGPVCAAALRMPPARLATSVLVEDSLAAGVSFFLAELKRIRQVVDAADRSRSEGAEGITVLYLLDEILRGTNSAERQVAVRRVVLHLLRQGAIGAISTHDLELATVPGLEEHCVPVHFRETLHPGGDGPAMTFDYRLRPGVATTVNALRLLEMVGLPGGEEDAGPA